MKRIGIIGGGAISKNHIKGYRNAGAEVVAVADPSEKARTERQKEFDLPEVYESSDDMLAKSDIDAVSICTPNVFHAPNAIQAVEAGKDVLCEKPPATNRDDAKKMRDAAKKAGKLVMMGFNQRFLPQAQKVNELREEGYFGEIYHAKGKFIRRRGIPGLGGWFTTKKMAGGGPIYDLGVHMLDRTWYMMGKPKPLRVSAKAYCKFGNPIADYTCVSMWAGPRRLDGTMDVEDFASAFIRFEGGKTLTLEASWAVNRDDEDIRSLLLGDKAGVELNGAGPNSKLKIFGEDNGSIVDIAPQFSKDRFPDRFQHFISCIEGKTTCTCSVEDGVTIQSILDAIYESSDQDKEVEVDL